MMIDVSTSRKAHSDDFFTDWHLFRLPAAALQFLDIDQEDVGIKLQDIAQLRTMKARERGAGAPFIVTFALLSPDQPVAHLFPDLAPMTDAGETLCSANSFITDTVRTLFRRDWIQLVDGRCEPDVPPEEGEWRRRAEAVLALLTAQERLHVAAGENDAISSAQADLKITEDIVPVAGCAFLPDFVRRRNPLLIFNTAFFLLEQDDTFHHHAALGEAHSFWMSNGVIRRPPLFRRGALWQYAGGQWAAGLLDMTALRLCLPGGVTLVHRTQEQEGGEQLFSLNAEAALPVVVYTRYYGVATKRRVCGYTPVEPGRFEITVVDRRVVGWKRHGGLALPHNGFVISFAAAALAEGWQATLLEALAQSLQIDYQFAGQAMQGVRQGIQAGPLLVQDGRSVLYDGYLSEVEQFWQSRSLDDGTWQIGVVATNYRTDINQTKSGRVGVGVDQNGDLLVVMAAGVNDGMGLPGVDSCGATLGELAQALCDAGAVSAVNMDGGGSTQAYYQGRQAVTPGDRRGAPGKIYERLVPAVGVVMSAQ